MHDFNEVAPCGDKKALLTALETRSYLAATHSGMGRQVALTRAVTFLNAAGMFMGEICGTKNRAVMEFGLKTFIPTGLPQSAPANWVEFMGRLNKNLTDLKRAKQDRDADRAAAPDRDLEGAIELIDTNALVLNCLWNQDCRLIQVIESMTVPRMMAAMIEEQMLPVDTIVTHDGNLTSWDVPVNDDESWIFTARKRDRHADYVTAKERDAAVFAPQPMTV